MDANYFLNLIYNQKVTLNKFEYQGYRDVFFEVIRQLQSQMKIVDPYYNQNGFQIDFDRLRIEKPNKFDVDIPIRIPKIGLTPEPYKPGHLRLRQKSLVIDCQGCSTGWFDDKGYLLRTEFLIWFKSVVDRALTLFHKNSDGKRIVTAFNSYYKINRYESGTACRLEVFQYGGFELDIGLMPALSIPESVWPFGRGYIDIREEWSAGTWLAIPKSFPNLNGLEASRCWRASLHPQEKRVLHYYEHMKKTNYLLKKLRNNMQMPLISNYSIKTLFLWASQEEPPSFWHQGPAFLFKEMVLKLNEAISDGEIVYFWNRNYNLLEHVPDETLEDYEQKLEELVDVLEDNEELHDLPWREIVGYLITEDEFDELIESDSESSD